MALSFFLFFFYVVFLAGNSIGIVGIWKWKRWGQLGWRGGV
jgi:hypothetical protein